MWEVLKYILLYFVSDQFLTFLFKKVPQNKRKLIFGLIFAIAISSLYNYFKITNGKNLYENFGLERTFTQDQLRKSWRNLARVYHPDKLLNSNVTENGLENINFTQYKDFHEILENNQMRVIYDKFGLEVATLFQRNQKLFSSIDMMNLSYGFLLKDAVFYIIFWLVLTTTLSKESLRVQKKACNSLAVMFYCIEVYLMVLDYPQYDIFDLLFPNAATYERLFVMKDLIGFFCLTIKSFSLAWNAKVSELIHAKLKKVLEMQSDLNSDVKTADTNDILKNGEKEFMAKLSKLNAELKEIASLCEQDKTGVKIENKKKLKKNLLTALAFMLILVVVLHFASQTQQTGTGGATSTHNA